MVKKEESFQSILDSFPVFEESDRGKLICTLTKHELPISEIANYVKTKRFLDQWRVHKILKQYGEYFQELEKGILACILTKRSLAKDGKTLENHVNGTRFRIALAKAEEEKLKAAETTVKEENESASDDVKMEASGNESDDEASSDINDDKNEKIKECEMKDMKSEEDEATDQDSNISVDGDEATDQDSNISIDGDEAVADEDTSEEEPPRKKSQKVRGKGRLSLKKSTPRQKSGSTARNVVAQKRKISDVSNTKVKQVKKKMRRSK